MVVGERLYLRPLEKEDIERGWLDWINDVAISRYLVIRMPETRESLERYWEASQPPQAAMFAICLKEDDTYIGNARLSGIDWLHRKCCHGWMIGDIRWQGKGLGSEALILLLRFGFQSLAVNRIYSGVRLDNARSIATHDRVGFRRDGLLRQDVIVDGQFVDSYLYSMLADEFFSLHGVDRSYVVEDKEPHK